MAKNGQIIVATSGVVQTFSTISMEPGTYLVRAYTANVGTNCFIGYTSQTATTLTGYILNKADLSSITLTVNDPDGTLWVNSDKSADIICWIKSEGGNVGIKAPAG